MTRPEQPNIHTFTNFPAALKQAAHRLAEEYRIEPTAMIAEKKIPIPLGAVETAIEAVIRNYTPAGDQLKETARPNFHNHLGEKGYVLSPAGSSFIYDKTVHAYKVMSRIFEENPSLMMWLI